MMYLPTTTPEAWQTSLESIARGPELPDALAARTEPLSHRDRVAEVWPDGLLAGAILSLRVAKLNGHATPPGIRSVTGPIAEAWARGVIATTPAPVAASINRRANGDHPQALRPWRAAVRVGLTLGLHALGVTLHSVRTLHATQEQDTNTADTEVPYYRQRRAPQSSGTGRRSASGGSPTCASPTRRSGAGSQPAARRAR